jgi:hypothetical protein
MRNDPGSNYNMLEVYASADVAIGTIVTSAVNHGTQGAAASFVVSAGSIATDSFTATLQHSASGATDWTDEVAGMGNDVSATVASPAGNCQINAPNPREQFSRLKIVLQGQTNLAVVAVAGPKTQIIPPDGVLES